MRIPGGRPGGGGGWSGLELTDTLKSLPVVSSVQHLWHFNLFPNFVYLNLGIFLMHLSVLNTNLAVSTKKMPPEKSRKLTLPSLFLAMHCTYHT